jgi:hypothetical protein
MHTSVRSDYLHCSGTTSLTSRTAVYGPVRTVVWQGSAGDCRPYADQTLQCPIILPSSMRFQDTGRHSITNQRSFLFNRLGPIYPKRIVVEISQ